MHRTVISIAFLPALISSALGQLDQRVTPLPDAIRASLELLERTSAGTADKRKCFTCHGQALPVITIYTASINGISVDEENLARQVAHTYRHLERGRERYVNGKGQGGGVDTAGYALWALEAKSTAPDEVTRAVVDWLLQKQHSDGHWHTSSYRPPSEASDFTATYLALRALKHFGEHRKGESDGAIARAIEWASATPANDTEDKVFQLLILAEDANRRRLINSAADQLLSEQRKDGGWAQLPPMPSDAYATATVLYALNRACDLNHHRAAWNKAIRFLRDTQKNDGSWHVVSRSDPFQTYFETKFPHGKDQFISTTATAWSAIGLIEYATALQHTNETESPTEAASEIADGSAE